MKTFVKPRPQFEHVLLATRRLNRTWVTVAENSRKIIHFGADFDFPPVSREMQAWKLHLSCPALEPKNHPKFSEMIESCLHSIIVEKLYCKCEEAINSNSHNGFDSLYFRLNVFFRRLYEQIDMTVVEAVKEELAH